jgi:hypothetical protein
VQYHLEHRARLRKPDKIVVRLQAEREVHNPPSFVLVHHPSRLPLHHADGQRLQVVLDAPQVTPAMEVFQPRKLGRALSSVGWSAEVRGLRGYVRLFASGGAMLALLDPDPRSLQVPPLR